MNAVAVGLVLAHDPSRAFQLSAPPSALRRHDAGAKRRGRRATRGWRRASDRHDHSVMNQLERCFLQLHGKACWGVKRGYGSFLTLEFGKPRLFIREPQAPPADASRRVRTGLERRLVRVHGQWHLWIYCCEWVVRKGDVVIGDWSSARRIDRAAQFLDGQKLSSAAVRPRGSRTRFEFDLGGVLETKPLDRTREQWLLYEPSGKVLALRADRKFAYADGDHELRDERWRSLGA